MQKKFNCIGGGTVSLPAISEIFTPVDGITVSSILLREFGEIAVIGFEFSRSTSTPVGTEIRIGNIAAGYRPLTGSFIGGTNHVGAFNANGDVSVRNLIAIDANKKQYIRSVYPISH